LVSAVAATERNSDGFIPIAGKEMIPEPRMLTAGKT
jgi:hypothetical protein